MVISKTMRRTVTGVALLMASFALPSMAASLRATPGTFDRVVANANGGDVVELAPGEYRGIVLAGRNFNPELTIDAHAASIFGAMISSTGGVTIRGGTFRLPPQKTNEKSGVVAYGAGLRMNSARRIHVEDATFIGPGAPEDSPDAPFGEGYGIFVLGGSEIDVGKSRFQGFKTGVVLTQTDKFKIASNTMTWMRSDGVQVSRSRNGVIEDNRCGSTRTRSTEHPDCIQLWSLPPVAPTADIVIRRNKMDGATQGIGLFNHIRKGVDDGGFDRITIEDNEVNVSRPNGITIVDGRKSIVRNNIVKTIAGSRWQARIRTVGDVVRCGNSVGEGGGRPAVIDPTC